MKSVATWNNIIVLKSEPDLNNLLNYNKWIKLLKLIVVIKRLEMNREKSMDCEQGLGSNLDKGQKNVFLEVQFTPDHCWWGSTHYRSELTQYPDPYFTEVNSL